MKQRLQENHVNVQITQAVEIKSTLFRTIGY